MIAPPGMPNITSTPPRTRASHMTWAPVSSRSGSDTGHLVMLAVGCWLSAIGCWLLAVGRGVLANSQRPIADGRWHAEYRSLVRATHQRLVPREPAARELARALRLLGPARGDLGWIEMHVEPLLGAVDGDHVAVAEDADRAAHRRLGGDVADAEAARAAGEAAVGHQRDLRAEWHPLEHRREREHLAHPRPAARPLVAHDDDVTRADPAVDERLDRR